MIANLPDLALKAAKIRLLTQPLKITGLTWVVERTFAWLGRSRRFAKDYERRPQTSETMIDIATVRLMINKLVPN